MEPVAPQSCVEHPLSFVATAEKGEVSGVLLCPDAPSFLYVLGHGAGAGMRHTFMEAIAVTLADRGVATLRYQFPYMENGSRRPDVQRVLLATVCSAVEAAAIACPGLPLIAGGKSMGGRMTSLAAAQHALPGVRGIACLGFPLHGVGQTPSTDRAEHLTAVRVPLLFVQGTRDKLADLSLMTGVCSGLGIETTLHVVDGADHGFHVLKRSGRSDEDVMSELADTVTQWGSMIVANQ